MLHKDGKLQLDRSCEKWSITQSEGRKERSTHNKEKK